MEARLIIIFQQNVAVMPDPFVRVTIIKGVVYETNYNYGIIIIEHIISKFNIITHDNGHYNDLLCCIINNSHHFNIHAIIIATLPPFPPVVPIFG